jgi:sugar porter (SP) family MFS transporter
MAVESIGQKITLGIICGVAAIAGLLFGYDTGVISSAIIFIRDDYLLTTTQESLIVAIVSIGAIFGAFLGGPLSDRHGRKKIVLASSLLFIFSSISLAWSPTIPWLIFGRLIVGVAIGVSSATAPLYISELSPRSFRGALVTLNQLFITIGIFLAYIAGLALAKSHGWRTMFLLAAVPAFIQFIVMMFFPESPRWLIFRNRTEEAKEILTRFRGSNHDVELEVEHILKHAGEKEGRWRDLFHKKARGSVIAGIGLTCIQQATGINTVIYFAPTIFQFAGFKSNIAAISATFWVGLVNVLATFIAIYLLDRVGRKPLLNVGLSGMIVSLFVLGLGFILPSHTSQFTNLVGWISLFSLMFYVTCFAFSLGPNGWLLNSEIYSLNIRGRAMGLATCANWGTNFIITFTFLPLISLIGKSVTFWLYGIIGLFGLWFIAKKIPETKGKSLEEIEDFWRK